MQLVFIHGSGGTGEVWQYQLEAFPGSVAPTLPGHPTGQVISTIEGYARWLHDYIHQNGYRDVVLVGHSLGGGIALQYALDYPGELKAMVPVGSGARLRVHPDFLKELEEAVKGDSGPWLKRQEERTALMEPAFRQKFLQTRMSTGPAPQLNDLLTCDKFDVMHRVGEIKLPTLLICGTEDVMTPVKYHQYLADRLPDARLVIIPGTTHYVFTEKPTEVNQALREFVEGL
ncbi:MAG: alpha/beta hydrolase [Dehalococcoidia bacterium]